MSKFEEFFDHEEENIVKMSHKLTRYEEMLAAGGISKSEFEELADDLLEYDTIDALAGDIERKVAYRKAFDALKSIVSIVSAL